MPARTGGPFTPRGQALTTVSYSRSSTQSRGKGQLSVTAPAPLTPWVPGKAPGRVSCPAWRAAGCSLSSVCLKLLHFRGDLYLA